MGKVFKDYFVEPDVVELPLGYVDASGEVHKRVRIQEMTGVAEEAIAAPAVRNNFGKLVSELLKHCVVEFEGLSGKEVGQALQALSVGERDLLFLAIRYLTYGEKVFGETVCPVCGQKHKYVVNLETLAVDDEGEVASVVAFELPKGLREGKKVLKKGSVKRPTGIEQEKYAQLAQKNVGLWKSYMLTDVVVDLEGKKLDLIQAKNLSKRDRDYLLEVANSYERVATSDPFTCTCGHTYDVPVLTENFFQDVSE